ncbi:hypothetical protein HCN44_005843 [Aphidius gifuensis]|uniref:Odorant receptor n=1 Tax=Aphidius gifuensis TaxID=684658 RepID=A0A835CR95_APHGI|nr:hypothetical protein HCN44_005843 [Aphidius gifuensis]
MKNKSQSIQVSTKENINYSTQLTRWVLTALGVWTNENKKTINDKILSTALIIMCYFSNFFLLIPCSLHTILSEKDMSLKMKALGPLTFCVMAIGKFSFLVKRKKDIYNCFKHVYHDWRRVQLINDENIMLENAKRGRFITILCAAFMYGGGLFYNTIMPFAVGSFVTADNKTIKPLTYAVYDPLFSAQETPNYQIVFTLQWFTGFFLCSITFGACSLAAVFAFHACGQLKIIISRLDNFIDRNHNFDDVLKKKMADIIELHLRTLSLHTFISEKNSSIKMRMIGPLSFCIMALSKFSLLVTRKKDIYNCFKHIYHDWKQVKLIDDENIMLENAGKSRFITIICAGFMYGGGFFYHTIMPFAVGSFVTADNKTIKPLTYPVYDPLFSAHETPNYQIVFTLQWFSGFFMCSITVGACSLAAVFAFHACGQLKIVISHLDNFIDRNHNFDDVLKNKMAVIIERHLRILGFILQVERLLNEINLIEFLGCTFIICMAVYYFLIVSFTFNIFIFCYIGEMLTQQGKRVGAAVYNNVNWYELTTKNSRGLILIAAMSNYPCSLSAGKMVNLSYASFACVCY